MRNNFKQIIQQRRIESFGNDLEEEVYLSKEKSDLSKFVGMFPNPKLAKHLINMVEDLRVDYLLFREFPGIKVRTKELNEKVLSRRPSIYELPPVEQVVELVTQLSVVGKTKEDIPPDLEDIVNECTQLAVSVKRDDSDVHDSAEVAAQMYMLLDDFFNGDYTNNKKQKQNSQGDSEESKNDNDQSSSSCNTPGNNSSQKGSQFGNGFKNYNFNPPEDLPYHGDINQDVVKGNVPSLEEIAKKAQKSGFNKSIPEIKQSLRELLKNGKVSVKLLEKKVMDVLNIKNRKNDSEKLYYKYKEWNYRVNDYVEEVHVFEEQVLPSDEIFGFPYSKKLIKLIRKEFEYIKPNTFEIRKKQEFGDEIDIDAAVESIVNIKATGYGDLNNVYIDRIRRKRDVSVALLLDITGSTQRFVDNKSVLDVEKESLYVMLEALNILGDEFGVYAFYSDGDVYYKIVKEFGEIYSTNTLMKLSSLESGGGTRLGGAIRHTARKLLGGSNSKTKMMIIISDGYPQDWGYGGEYAIEDVSMAVKEAKDAGILTFSVTVDTNFNTYKKANRKAELSKMYGQLGYFVLTDVRELPHKLPKIYRRLTS